MENEFRPGSGGNNSSSIDKLIFSPVEIKAKVGDTVE
jgi:hypothetical protein